MAYRIGMIDADLLNNGTRHPNLAQMKISAYCKGLGHSVELIHNESMLKKLDDYDILILSKVFNFSILPPNIDAMLPERPLEKYNKCVKETIQKHTPGTKEIIIGGTGFFPDGGINLDHDIEHILPDYHLYDSYVDEKIAAGRDPAYFNDYRDFSIGFTTRGCFRQCSFCVNRKYKRCQPHAHVSEFLDETRPKIYLWDDNFLAYHGWKDILDELNATGKPFQFRQGLDIRLMTEKRAEAFSKSNYYGDFIFAFDHISDRELIEKKLKLWRKHYLGGTKLYVLCAYDPWSGLIDLRTQDERDQKDIENTFERISILIRFGCLPYIMRYESYRKSKYRGIYTQLARWCNQPQFLKRMSFREFCYANQNYHRGSGKCSAVIAFETLERDRPDIVKQYADIKWETTNEYLVNTSIAKPNGLDCHNCMRRGITWDAIMGRSREEIISHYYAGDLDLLCLDGARRKCCSCSKTEAIDALLDAIENTSMETIIGLIASGKIKTFDEQLYPWPESLKITDVLKKIKNNDARNYETIIPSKMTERTDKTGFEIAYFLAQLDLIYANIYTSEKNIRISPIGNRVLQLDDEKGHNIIRKMMLRLPIINKLITTLQTKTVSIDEFIKRFEKQRLKRKAQCLIKIIEFIEKGGNVDRYFENLKRT